MTSMLLLAGSPSDTSRTARLLRHVGEQLAALGHQPAVLQVRDLPAQALLHADLRHGAVQAALAQVAAASAVVVATPIYKAAYSGILKAFLDLLPQDGLTGKLVLPIATGGSPAHMLALDYALRPVLASMGARHVLPGIYATEAQVQWVASADGADRGQLRLDPAIAQRVREGIHHFCDGLAALRTAQIAQAAREARSAHGARAESGPENDPVFAPAAVLARSPAAAACA